MLKLYQKIKGIKWIKTIFLLKRTIREKSKDVFLIFLSIKIIKEKKKKFRYVFIRK